MAKKSAKLLTEDILNIVKKRNERIVFEKLQKERRETRVKKLEEKTKKAQEKAAKKAAESQLL